MATIEAQIRIRRDTAANFTSANPTLALGEIAYETDTRNIKVGDGATAWTALSYINPYRGGTASAPTSNTVLGSGAGAAMQAGAEDNVLIGLNAGNNITTADGNVFIGKDVGNQTTGSNSVAIGWEAMASSGSAVFNSVAVGYRSLWQATGGNNVAVGLNAETASGSFSGVTAVGASAASLNTSNDITAVGANALDANTTGTNNTAVGKDALGANTTGANNVAIGNGALDAITTSGEHTAVGTDALGSLTSGIWNTAVGRAALAAATTGSQNVAIGWATAGGANPTRGVYVGERAGGNLGGGNDSVAIGSTALLGASGASATPGGTVAIGSGCLQSINGGNQNVAIGQNALQANTTGSGNTVVGAESLQSSIGGLNTSLGFRAGRFIAPSGSTETTASDNSIFIGATTRPAGQSQTNQIVIGHEAIGNGSNTTTIGNSSTTGTFIPAGNLTVSNGTLNVRSTSGTGTLNVIASDNDSITLEAGTTFNQIFTFNNNNPFYISAGSTDIILRTSNNQTRMTVGNGGDISIANGNLVMSTSGKGIDFSATANSSGTMTSELLSDYEEGTWTPTITFGGASVAMTYTTQAGSYTKIGRTVHIYCRVTLSAKGTSTGAAEVRGFPFTAKSNEFPYIVISPGNVTYVGTPYIYVGGGSTSANFAQVTEAGAFGLLVETNFANNSDVIFMATYFV